MWPVPGDGKFSIAKTVLYTPLRWVLFKPTHSAFTTGPVMFLSGLRIAGMTAMRTHLQMEPHGLTATANIAYFGVGRGSLLRDTCGPPSATGSIWIPAATASVFVWPGCHETTSGTRAHACQSRGENELKQSYAWIVLIGAVFFIT